ncbi:Ca(2+)/calmodulin-responsive adenylate cyclase-like protein [Leptotrombidium deliense]|uniref:Ca(2+)/calmodulin-responsive adenylate cyclase-like protein n=1 Tax=Leptotrombidium deliense TaxID=299467 RepID=A0A443S5H3_9ACAR|nr:Ca(2+)/calmodulin-responsive adenylate cyclase-like protein [Leptotrombidium deliense]
MTNSHRKVAFSRLFNRRRFENKELEKLYQRYIFKLQQSSIICVLALFSMLTLTMAALEFHYNRTITVLGLYCSLQFIATFSLLIVFQVRDMKDSHLKALCYVILLFCLLFCVMYFPVDLQLRHEWLYNQWWDKSHNAAEGVWQIVFVVFLVYTLLPIKTRVAVFIGLLLPCGHTAVAATLTQEFPEMLWQQVNKQIKILHFLTLILHVLVLFLKHCSLRRINSLRYTLD